MIKLKAGLLIIVVLYVIYGILHDGLTTSMAVLLALIVFLVIGQIWQHSSWRKKLRQHRKN